MITTAESADLHRHALIVGASRGLGLAIAEAYLARGTHVVGTVRPGPRTKLHALRERWPDQLEIETVDITFIDQVAALRSRLEGKMVTNALSPMRAIETLRDLVDPNGTIAVMSSGQGSVANNESGGYEVYRASKAALNTLMRSYAARHASDRRTLLLLAPGWIRTDMGGPSAPFSVEESIPVLVATIEAQRGKSGLQYIDRQGHTVRW